MKKIINGAASAMNIYEGAFAPINGSEYKITPLDLIGSDNYVSKKITACFIIKGLDIASSHNIKISPQYIDFVEVIDGFLPETNFVVPSGIDTFYFSIDFNIYKILTITLPFRFAIKVKSDNSSDTSVIIETMMLDDSVNVGLVNGVEPTTKEEIAEETAVQIIQSEDPSSQSLSPISVDSNGHVILSPTGLDNIDITEPSGKATTFKEMLIQLWMRFFNKVEKDNANIKVYEDGGVFVSTTQTIEKNGETTIVNEP